MYRPWNPELDGSHSAANGREGRRKKTADKNQGASKAVPWNKHGQSFIYPLVLEIHEEHRIPKTCVLRPRLKCPDPTEQGERARSRSKTHPSADLLNQRLLEIPLARQAPRHSGEDLGADAALLDGAAEDEDGVGEGALLGHEVV